MTTNRGKVDLLRGFTLIELLVVVSIIALLVSILLPALGRAREQAKSVLCLSNMREAANALVLYADNYGGHVPPGRQHPGDLCFGNHPFGNEHAVDWSFLLLWTVGGFKAEDYSIPGPDNDVYEDQNLKANSFIHCPSWPVNPPSGFGGSFSFGYGWSLNMTELDNSWKSLQVTYSAAYYASPKLDNIRHPADYIFAGDSPHSCLHNFSWITNRDEWRDAAIDHKVMPDGPLDHPAKPDSNGFYPRMHWSLCDPYRHLGGANYMFLDGHAEHLKATDGYYVYTRVQQK